VLFHMELELLCQSQHGTFALPYRGVGHDPS
jgi:hypothetical protein